MIPNDDDDELDLDPLVEEVRSHLSANPSEDFVEELAEQIVENLDLSDIGMRDNNVADALDSFCQAKLQEVESKKQYNRKLEYIAEYVTTEIEATRTLDLTAADIRGYKQWRKYESLDREEPLADSTLQDDMYLYREFIEYLISSKYLPHRMLTQIDIPTVDYQNGEGVDTKKLDPEFAKIILDYLRRYQYASVEHVTFELFCSGGPRKSDCRSSDVSDFDPKEGRIKYTDHDGELKKGSNSERSYSITEERTKIINDYIEDIRPDITDVNGREPLLTDGDGRLSKSKIQDIAYQWTRPCKVGLDCPHNKDPNQCGAAKRKNHAYKCPSSRAPHHVRKGYITDNRSRGVSPDAINARCDVSPRTQDIHYDLPDKEEQRERADTEFEERDSDPNSGYQP